MSDAKKLRRAAAEHLGCDPSDLILLEITPSREFNYDGGTTTWVLTEDAAGNIAEVTMEQVLDLPTTYPLERGMHCVSGDYETFRLSQELGKQAHRDYLRTHSENHGDPDDTERIRQLLGRRIRQNAQDLMEREQQNQIEGNRRLARVVTGQAA